MLPAAQTRDKSSVRPEQMIRLTDDLRKDFDYILIDCPAGIEGGFKNAIAPADRVLLVTTPEVSAVRDADRIIGLVEAAEKEAPKLIINRLRGDATAIAQEPATIWRGSLKARGRRSIDATPGRKIDSPGSAL